MKNFTDLVEDAYKNMLGHETLNEDSDKYVKDTISYIEDVLKNVDDKGAEKFLKGIKDYLEKNKYLTPGQRSGLAAFNTKNPDSKQK